MSRALRPIAFVLAVLIVGFGGVYVGKMLRANRGGGAEVTAIPVPKSLLKDGMEFPEVDLVDASGSVVNSLDVVPAGGVVLFLDLQCPPCTDMALRWQRAFDEGLLEGAPLCAVTWHAPDAVAEFRSENQLTFPVYRDSLMTFHDTYEIDRFPLEVVVGRSGRIRSTSYDSESPIDPVLLHEQLGN